jgi:hypothetical protein
MGIENFHLTRYEEAMKNFEESNLSSPNIMAYGYMMEICAILARNHLLINLYNEVVPLIKSCITKDKNLE